MKVAAVQMTSGPDVAANVDVVEQRVAVQHVLADLDPYRRAVRPSARNQGLEPCMRVDLQ